MEKWPFLTKKPWVNPFGKISIFRLFEPVVFIGWRGVFLFCNIVKHIFLAYIAKTNDMEKWPFFDKNHGSTPLEKSQFFDFLNVLFLQARKAFFLFWNIVKHIFLAYIAKKKKDMDKWPFFHQNHGLTPLEKSQFFDFLNFFFYGLERGFFVAEYSKTYFPGLYCLKKKTWKNGHFFTKTMG